MKRFLILICLFTLLIPFNIFALVDKEKYSYVTDDAGILSDKTYEYINTYSKFLFKTKKIDFQVVTIEDTEGLDLLEYTDQLYQKFKIRDRGVLIVFSNEDRSVQVQVGSSLNHIFTNKIIDDFLDKYFVPYLEIQEYDKCISNGYTAIYKYICEKYNIDASSLEAYDKVDFFTKYRNIIILVILTGAFIESMGFARTYNLKRFKVFNLIISIIINILLIVMAFYISLLFGVFIILSELLVFFVNINANKNNKSNKKRKVKKR